MNATMMDDGGDLSVTTVNEKEKSASWMLVGLKVDWE